LDVSPAQSTIRIAKALFGSVMRTAVLDAIDNTLVEVEWILDEAPQHHPSDYYYDQIVSIGEMLSTRYCKHVSQPRRA
jgi:hypothetical protein